MTLKDLAVTPILLIIIFIVALQVRKRVSYGISYRYFLPALGLKIFGAIMLGVIYQFYYGGGDTFNYWTHGSEHVYHAFMDNFFQGLRLWLNGTSHLPETFEYSTKIWYFKDSASYQIIRIAALFDIITFHTYSATAALFAVFSFSGLWALYQAFLRFYPQLIHWLAISVLFIPGVIFWGSGLLKDTITLGATGWVVYSVVDIYTSKQLRISTLAILVLSIYLIATIKVYILLCLIPGFLVWVYIDRMRVIKSTAIKLIIGPILVLLVGLVGYVAIDQVGQIDQKYALANIPERVRITAYDIAYGWGAGAGSTYSLGEIEPTYFGILKLAPRAIFVSLFQPFLWQSNNILMLIAALESSLILLITVFILFRTGLSNNIYIIRTRPIVSFSILFAISFAFAVGVSSYNFGTLMRYKIPMLPFYLSGMLMLYFENQALRAKSFKNSV